ncbi:MAG: N-acetylglucosamine kinase, partial [Lactobacillus crispatus]|nr:N-acetylglucosamine kinase [Lactobacillus crispatus]
DNGSEDAQNVIFSQADLLADDIIMGLDRFADPKPMAIALTGSVLTNNKMLRTRVEDKVHAKYPNAKFVISSGSNASGILFDKNDDYYTA